MHGDRVIDLMARHLRAADRLATPGPVGEPDQDDIERAVALRDDLLTHNVRIIAPVPDDTQVTAAVEIARVLARQPNGDDPDTVARLPEAGWSLAAELAGVARPDAEVRRLTLGLVRSAAETPDPFAAFTGSDR